MQLHSLMFAVALIISSCSILFRRCNHCDEIHNKGADMDKHVQSDHPDVRYRIQDITWHSTANFG